MYQMGKCSMCERPAVGAINANANMNGMADAVWKLRCDKHNPYWNAPATARYQAALERILAFTRHRLEEPEGVVIAEIAEIATAALKGKSAL